MALGHQLHPPVRRAAISKETDAVHAQNGAEARRQTVSIAQMLKKETADTLDKVLYELSGLMKNAYARSDA